MVPKPVSLGVFSDEDLSQDITLNNMSELKRMNIFFILIIFKLYINYSVVNISSNFFQIMVVLLTGRLGLLVVRLFDKIKKP